MIAACILMGVAGAAAGRLAAPRAGLRGHYYTNLTRSGTPIAVTIVRYARGPFLNRPRSADEPVRPLVVAYIRHAKIPMAVVVALALFGLIAYVAGRPPQLMAGVFFGAGGRLFHLSSRVWTEPAGSLPVAGGRAAINARGAGTDAPRSPTSVSAPAERRRDRLRLRESSRETS